MHIRTLFRDVMASLAELLEIDLTIQDVMLTFLKALQSKSERLFTGSLSTEEVPMFQSYYERVMERNRKCARKLKEEWFHTKKPIAKVATASLSEMMRDKIQYNNKEKVPLSSKLID